MEISIWCLMMPATRALVCIVCCAAALSASSVRDDGIAAFHDGRYSVAFEKLKQAIQKDPADLQARVFLALTEAARNDCKSALAGFSSLGELADNTLARLAGIAAARCLQTTGNNSAAFVLLHKLAQRFPKDADVLYILAKFHMRAFTDTTMAMFQHTPASYRVHQLSAEIFEVQGRYDEAISEYRRAISLNPAAPTIHFRLGRALLMSAHDPKVLDQARAEFTAELKLSPEDAACEFQLGQIDQIQNRQDGARRHFERAAALSPDFPEALVALGRVHLQEKRYQEAIPLLERAVKLQSANEAAHYALMMAYRN